MFQNTFKIAWRNLVKDLQFTLLNVLGLAAGLACFLLIYLWVHQQLGMDHFGGKGSQIYQVLEQRNSAGRIAISDESPGPLSETLAKERPEIKYAAAVAPPDWFQKFTLSVGDKDLKAAGQYAGKDYFQIFPFKLLAGNKSQVLADKNDIVISDQLAKRLFNTTQNLIGKPILLQHHEVFVVSGVFQHPSDQSSQQFDFVLSFEYLKDIMGWVTSWNNTGPHHFLLLKKGTHIRAFNQEIASVVAKYSGDTTRTAFAIPFAKNSLENTFVHGARTGGDWKM
ncbi:MAG TPA: ABC transporter permease [Chitinophagaceae bacterium]|nr:ABC transporter permease [Chitinophagaceae bacterium]